MRGGWGKQADGDEREGMKGEIASQRSVKISVCGHAYMHASESCTLRSVLCRSCHVDVIINMCHAVFVQKSLSVKQVNHSFKS